MDLIRPLLSILVILLRSSLSIFSMHWRTLGVFFVCRGKTCSERWVFYFFFFSPRQCANTCFYHPHMKQKNMQEILLFGLIKYISLCLILRGSSNSTYWAQGFPLERIVEFIGSFNVVRLNSRNCVRLPTDKDQVGQFLSSSVLPDTSRLYMLSHADISKPMKYRFKNG